jgi:aryl-alcohol dehydrogenase-like predicted oxidoreductase
LEYVDLGRTGLKVSKISLGCLGFGSPDWMPWILDEAGSRQVGRGVYTAADYDVADAVNAVARSRGCKPAVVALAWQFSRPEVTAPIVGAYKLEHLEDALAAESVKLSSDEIRQLEAPYRPKPHVGASERDVEVALERHRETVVDFARLQTAA